MNVVSWKIWFIRLTISLVLGAVVAWTVSFWVADYVVRANTSSANEAMSALQRSIDQLNSSVRDNVAATNRLQNQISEMMKTSAAQSIEIAAIKENLGKVTDAVQDSGIVIRMSVPDNTGKEKVLRSEDLRLLFDLPPNAPLYWSIQ